MKYNILKSENIYPLVLVPNEIKSFFKEDISFLDLCKEANLTYPKDVEKAHSTNVNYFYLDSKYTRNETVDYRTLQEIDDLKYNSCDSHLENRYFYFGTEILPKKPSFYKKVFVKEKIDYSEDFGLFWFSILFLFLSSSFLMIFGPLGLLFNFLSEYFSISYWLIFITTIIIPSITFSIYNLLKVKERPVKQIYKDELMGSEEEITLKLYEYKKIVHQLFKLANEKVTKERKWIEDWVESQREEIQQKIIKSRLNEFQWNIKEVNNTKRGKTELFFLQFLYGTFKNDVKIDVAPAMKNAFLPDFVIIYSDLGLLIDVEIDEPYSLESGEVIHHDRSRDSARNQFFTSHNWIVIRFSERQIVENPKGCVSFIENIISAIGKKDSVIETDLKIESTWTYEEVHLMKLRDERKKYLSLYDI